MTAHRLCLRPSQERTHSVSRHSRRARVPFFSCSLSLSLLVGKTRLNCTSLKRVKSFLSFLYQLGSHADLVCCDRFHTHNNDEFLKGVCKQTFNQSPQFPAQNRGPGQDSRTISVYLSVCLSFAPSSLSTFALGNLVAALSSGKHNPSS